MMYKNIQMETSRSRWKCWYSVLEQNEDHYHLNPNKISFSARGCNVRGEVAGNKEYSAYGGIPGTKGKGAEGGPVEDRDNPSNGKQGL